MSDLFDADTALDKLRADFHEVAIWHMDTSQWTGEEAMEIGNMIKSAIDQGDPGVMACWRAWMAQQAEEVRSLKAMGGPRMRALEAAVRAEHERAAA